ncbi:MAG: LacI family DNA-binding transcriptional regulator [Chloroflexota bacterium]
MTIKRSHHQRVKIDDVAREAGVSTATVSRVINGTGTVSPTTQQRVHHAIRSLRFVAHGSARGLAGSKTNTIGIVMPALTTFFFAALIKGINESIEEQGYTLLMYSSNSPASMIGGKPLPLGDHNTDGLIVFTDFLDDYSIQYMFEQGLPIVMLHRTAPAGLDIPVVAFHNEKGAFEAVNHLIENGRRRIVFLKGPEGNEDSRQRELGYRRALASADLPVDENLIRRGKFATTPAKQAIETLLQEGAHFDAIFAGDDNAAVGALEACRDMDISVPGQIAIVGFNDDYMARHVSPALSTVSAPIYESGFKAGTTLLKLIAGQPVNNAIRLETKLVVRDSSRRNGHG